MTFTIPICHNAPSGEPHVTYASWAATGSPFSIGSSTFICPLDGLDIAVVDTTADTLSTLRWGGSSFSVVGNALSIGALEFGIFKFSSTRVATLNVTNDEVLVYEFDGTDWTQIGNAFSLTFLGTARGCNLGDNLCAIHDNSAGFAKYSFDGTDISKVGNTFADTADFGSLAPLTGDRVGLFNSGSDEIETIDFGGTNWTQTGNSFAISPAVGGNYGVEAMSLDQMLYFNSNTQMQTLIFDGTDWAKEGAANSLTGLGSFPRSIARMTQTLIAYNSFSDGNVRAAVATLS